VKSARPARRSHPSLLAWMAFVAGSAALLGGAWLAYEHALSARVLFPRTPEIRGHRFYRVEQGDSFARIARRLARQRWIASAWPLRIEARRLGFDRRVAPGLYRYVRGETVRGLLLRLGRGEIEQTRLTIPEGWRMGRILATLSDSAWVPLDSLQAAAQDSEWLLEQQVPGPGLEGYLFPDTYLLPKGESSRRLLACLLAPSRQLWRDSLQVDAVRLGLDQRGLWTLASMIEAEAAVPIERPRISAVFWNRLRLGMRLESDPTVQYALDRPPGRLLLSDLDVDSPYNTYRSAGLPAGPICSPGLASLRAALHPLAGCEDLFFVARGDGTHVFSRSLAAHERARRALKSAGAG
jgi:UPF0755 protein